MRRRLLACLALLAVFGVPTLSAAQPLRLGVEGAYPPFSEIGPDGKLKGFDIDIADALCRQMKVECVQVQVEFDAMIPALRAKKIDAIVASMSVTAERRKVVDFSDLYYQSVARWVGRESDRFEISAAGLKGKRIGVQRATIHDRFASATFKDSTLVRYTKQDEVWLDLLAGRIDGTLVDNVAASEGFLKTPAGKGYTFHGPVFDDPAFFGDGPGIAVRKGDTALQSRLNAALAAIIADGTHRRLQARYFPFDISPPARAAGKP